MCAKAWRPMQRTVVRFPDIDFDYGYFIDIRETISHELKDFLWIKSTDHLKRVNKYRKRAGQQKIVFSDSDMAELILLKG